MTITVQGGIAMGAGITIGADTASAPVSQQQALGTITVGVRNQFGATYAGYLPVLNPTLGSQSANIFLRLYSDSAVNTTEIIINSGTYGLAVVTLGAVNGDVFGSTREFTVNNQTATFTCANAPGGFRYTNASQYALGLSSRDGQTLPVSVTV